MKKLTRFLLVLFFITMFIPISNTQGQPVLGPSVPVQGLIVSQVNNAPVPGLTVFLVHEILGRSTPAFTDVYGRFGWSMIPIRPEPYFLEVYWGENLIYRQPIQVSGPIALPPIFL
jgi:hypothetical protein